ncbi:hypothetical protein [Jannaschia sp. CCS1]|uniref:hypothetical protein n=1 Tax=Jannaschia sp. (strain CCS1) TaxID=290400 RepID=UPI000053D181|nr:hypothetical protein [Jannaschia sp. CCS1]ABD55938.1 hypothetical protein Jann_3021 [Jannaschia sp. CCS1]
MADLTIDEQLDKMIGQCGTNSDAWVRGPLDVLCTAYSRAHARYNETLAQQQAADDLKVEIALTILLAGAGAALAAAPISAMLLGSAAGRTIQGAAKVTKGVQLRRILDAASTNLANRTVVKAVLNGVRKDTIALLRRKGLAAAVASTHSPSGNLTDGHPDTLRSVLRGDVSRSFTDVENMLRELRYTKGHEAEKLDVIQRLRGSRLVAPTVTSLEPLRATFERRFELVFFMSLLMEQDYTVSISYPSGYSPYTGGAKITHVPVKQMPTASDYPKRGVHRRDFGGHIEAKINKLYAAELADGAARFTGPRQLIRQNTWSEENTPQVMRNGARVLEILSDATDLKTLLPQPAL